MPATDPGTPEASGPTTTSVRHWFAGRIEEHVAECAGRCHFAIVDRGLAAIGHSNHHEPATAQVAGGRVCHGKSKTHGDGGVDGVAAMLQDVEAGAAGELVGRPHHAVASPHGLARCGPEMGNGHRRDEREQYRQEAPGAGHHATFVVAPASRRKQRGR